MKTGELNPEREADVHEAQRRHGNRLVVVGVPLVLVLAPIIVWAIFPASVSVRNVREAETLVLGRETGSPYTWAISIRGSGRIDGEATISLLMGEGRPYQTEHLSGTVDFEWSGDWYSETARVRYEPVNVRSGNVVLRYRFRK